MFSPTMPFFNKYLAWQILEKVANLLHVNKLYLEWEIHLLKNSQNCVGRLSCNKWKNSMAKNIYKIDSIFQEKGREVRGGRSFE
jgi:hypothetical protein